MDNSQVKGIIASNINNHQFKTKEELQIFINNVKQQLNNALSSEDEQALLDLYERTTSINPAPSVGYDANYQNILSDLENKVNNNQFSSKEELINYINNLKNNGMPSDILTTEKVIDYLNRYDALNRAMDPALDLENYKGVKLENTNLIVGTEQDAILKTDKSNSELPQEFKENQNELTAQGEDGLANADEVFEHMREHEKEELSLISVNEAINKDNIDIEILNKIKFFITNQYINSNEYKVDIENAIFYNIETSEVLEVRKNEETNQYEIYRGGEKVYGDNSNSETESNDNENDNENENELEEDTDEEKMSYENKNVKVRRLIKPKEHNSAAFVRGGLLFIICAFLSFLLSIIFVTYYK